MRAGQGLEDCSGGGPCSTERLIRFSLVGDDYKARAVGCGRRMTELRELGYEIEYWGVFERNPKGTGHHFHAWNRGAYIPQRALQKVCQGHGMGLPDIRKWNPDRPGGGGAAYGLKGSSRYGLKADDVLDLNGGRFGTWTRDFFGMPYKQALAEAVRAYYEKEPRNPAQPGASRTRRRSSSQGHARAEVVEWTG